MEEILCYYGCGQAAKFGNLKTGSGYGWQGDPPRCAAKMSECPAIARKALRAARAAGRLPRRR
jgi:hypothetical protein